LIIPLSGDVSAADYAHIFMIMNKSTRNVKRGAPENVFYDILPIVFAKVVNIKGA
jgi:hypothetical protein